MIGEGIAKARIDRGRKMREVARAAGISTSTLARIEADQVSPSVNTVFQLATALDIQLASLFESQTTGPEDGDASSSADVELERLLGGYRRLAPDKRALILEMVESLAGMGQGDHADRPLTPPGRSSRVVREQEPRHYVQGWKRETVLAHRKRGARLGHTAGAQFSKPFERIARNDFLWVVFVHEGKLHLAGRMQIAGRRDFALSLGPHADLEGVIFSQHEAQSILGTSGVWRAPEHLLAKGRTAESFGDVLVPRETVRQLEFRTTAGTSRVKINGRAGVAAQSFRSVRLLDPEAADRLNALWRPARRARRR